MKSWGKHVYRIGSEEHRKAHPKLFMCYDQAGTRMGVE
jgi:hypothetical protein